jgi:16S rRNA (adenine(1408)-N(1))-methyltransferase
VAIDVGTGDGRAVLAVSAREPTTLVLGVDASAAAMAEASRRAAGPARRGGRENARFVVASAEALPAELTGRAALVTVLFPWGSLLRGCLGGDEAVASGLAGLVAPGGALELMLAPSARDALDGIPTAPAEIVEAATRTFARHAFEVVDAREATPAEIAATGSTWAKRLGVAGRGNGSDRSPVLIRLARR